MRAPLRIRSDGEQRSTNLEQFFDLVFVFALTQVSTLLTHELNWTGAGSALFLLLVAWWAWIYTTWMTNWFDPDAAAVRVMLLFVMLAGLFMSIAIPRAFGALGLMFALAYVALQLVRNAFIVVGTDRAEPLHPSFERILAWSAWTGALWIAGGVLAGEARVIIWLVALICDYAGPFAGYWTPGLGRSQTSDWELEHAHFVERFQLFILIALGESITATGASAAAHSHLGGDRIAAIAVGFAITAALWWLYFDHVAARSAEDFAAAEDRGQLGRDAFTYLHIPIVAGIVLAAVANKIVIARPAAAPGAAQLLTIAGGPALYLAGHLAFRARMTATLSATRAAAILAIGGAGALGTLLPAVATEGLVTLILVGTVIVEVSRGRVTASRPGRARSTP